MLNCNQFRRSVMESWVEVMVVGLDYLDFGDIPLNEADYMNIPVGCWLEACDGGKWVWRAGNYMPRKDLVEVGRYHIEATSKEKILEAVRAYVVPLYKNALRSLEETGELCYWMTATTHKRRERKRSAS